MAGRILYKFSVSRDLKKIDRHSAERILREIRTTLVDNPRAGEALLGEFKGLFKLRIGDYRVIYTLVEGDVLVLRIGHRSRVYQ